MEGIMHFMKNSQFDDMEHYIGIRYPPPDTMLHELFGMDLDELVPLASALEENPDEDMGQLELYAYTNCHIYRRSLEIEFLFKSIDAMELFLGMLGTEHQFYERVLKDLVFLLYLRVASAPDASYVEYLRLLIEKAQHLHEITDPMDPVKFPRWKDLFVMHRKLAQHTQIEEDREKCLQMGQDMLEAGNFVGPLQAMSFEEFQAIPDRKECIKKLIGYLTYYSAETDDREDIRNRIIMLTTFEWDQYHRKEDLDKLIDVCEKFIRGAPSKHKEQRQAWLAEALQDRWDLNRTKIEDLDRSIKVLEEVLTTTDRPELRQRCLQNLRVGVGSRYEFFHRMEDLERTVRMFERCVDYPDSHDLTESQATRIKFRLSRYLIDIFRFKNKKTAKDFELIDRSIALLQELEIANKDPSRAILGLSDWPDSVEYAMHIASALNTRYVYTHNLADIELCIRYIEGAVTPNFNRYRKAADCLIVLINALRQKYDRLGNIEDLNLAVRKAEEALTLITPQSNANFEIIDSLICCLTKRFSVTGDEEHITEAIKFGEKLWLCPDSNPEKGLFLNNLTAIYFNRYERYSRLEDIENACRVQLECIKITPRNHYSWGLFSMNTGRVLFRRWHHYRDLSNQDVNRAIAHVQDSIEASIEQGQDTAPSLHALAYIYFKKSELTRDVADIDLAIDNCRKAIAICESGILYESLCKLILASCISLKCKETPDPDPELLAEGAKISIEIMEREEVAVDTRISCGSIAANCIIQLGSPEEIAMIEEKVVRLLPLSTSRAVKQRDQQYWLEKHAGYCTKAVASAFRAGKSAPHCLELLEFGRGIIHSMRFENRTDVTKLANEYPDLANRFIATRDGLEAQVTAASANSNESNGETQDDPLVSLTLNPDLSHKHELTVTFNKILKEIRRKPGFDTFLQPPRSEDLRTVTCSPMEVVVVINISFRCDAIILQNGEIRHLHLPHLRREDVDRHVLNMRLMRWNRSGGHQEQSRNLSRILIWLWTTTVRPILDELRFTSPPSDNKWPRVWWVPTGALTQLPLHAAGYHSPDRPNESALDRVVSSYSSSIKALMYTRRHQRDKDPKDPMNKIILTSMFKTEGAGDLKFADEEVNELQKILSPTGAHTVKLKEPSKSELMRELKSSSIFHFAGHGSSHPEDPSASCLHLKDWKTNPFTVEDLIGMNLYEQSPWLAYLSACSTGETKSGGLYDEAIHLMSACHSAGFQHVIGSLWEISDWHSLETARIVYRELKDGLGTTGDIALALHTAVRHLRDFTADHSAHRNVIEYIEEVEEDLELSNDDSNEEGITTRGDRAVKSVKHVSTSLTKSEPLIWAAYIHVGL